MPKQEPSAYASTCPSVLIPTDREGFGQDRGEIEALLLMGTDPSNPWQGVEFRYPPGVILEGRVTRMAEYGVAVELEKGVEGYVPLAFVTRDEEIKHPSEVLSVGDQVKVVVLHVQVDKHAIVCSIRITQCKYPRQSAQLEELEILKTQHIPSVPIKKPAGRARN